MKTNRFLFLFLTLSVALATAAADKVKRADISDYPFYTVKKRGQIAQFVPGLNAVLGLTEAQQEQIAAARDEMLNDEAVKAARSLSKTDPAVTAEQRERARAVVESAMARLREKVATTLTPKQKALIETINATHAAAVGETAILYESYFANLKEDEDERRRLHREQAEDILELFMRKLDRVLTADQKVAITRAREEENLRLAKNAGIKKPAK
jgi:DNA-binding MarR family transcriptional regulator